MAFQPNNKNSHHYQKSDGLRDPSYDLPAAEVPRVPFAAAVDRPTPFAIRSRLLWRKQIAAMAEEPFLSSQGRKEVSAFRLGYKVGRAAFLLRSLQVGRSAAAACISYYPGISFVSGSFLFVCPPPPPATSVAASLRPKSLLVPVRRIAFG